MRARACARRLLPLLAAGLLVLALVATGGARAQAPGPPAACGEPEAPGSSQITLSSAGRTRTATVHVPPGASGRPLPVLVALHGANQNGAFFEGYTGFSTVADAEGFIAVYPDATPVDGRPFWTINDDRPGAADDVTFVSDLLDRLQSTLCVNPARVYATGVSNGAGMAARLACELSTRIVAIAPVAGGYKSLPPCEPQDPVSVLEIHGTNDGTVPYLGNPSHAGNVPAFIGAWRARDHCPSAKRTSRPAARVLRIGWAPCEQGTQVAQLEISGGGHQLPGAMPPDRGQASTFSAAWSIWRFLRGLHRP